MRERVTVETTAGVTWRESVWSGGELVAERDSDGTILTYVWGPDRTPLAVKVASSVHPSGTYYYHTDAAGSVVALTDESGGVVATYAYDAFGAVTDIGGSDAWLAGRNPLRYRAYYADDETGLYYLPARYYEPSTARFLSPDPAPPSAGDPLSLNAYAYCQGDPVNASDPTGAIIDIDGDGRVDPEDSRYQNEQAKKDSKKRRDAAEAEPTFGRAAVSTVFGVLTWSREQGYVGVGPVLGLLHYYWHTYGAGGPPHVSWYEHVTSAAGANRVSLLAAGACNSVGILTTPESWLRSDVSEDDLQAAVVTFIGMPPASWTVMMIGAWQFYTGVSLCFVPGAQVGGVALAVLGASTIGVGALAWSAEKEAYGW